MSFQFALIQIYLDTSGLIKYSQTQDPDNPERKILQELYKLYRRGFISLFTTQGSFSDIYGDNNEKITSDISKISADEREKTRVELTFPLATDYIESKSGFDDKDIKLFNILFNESTTDINIFEKYSCLNTNDKVDFSIIRDSIKDTNNLSFFLTRNPKDFVYNGKKEKIEKFAESLGKTFKVRTVTDETLNEIKMEIEQIKQPNANDH